MVYSSIHGLRQAILAPIEGGGWLLQAFEFHTEPQLHPHLVFRRQFKQEHLKAALRHAENYTTRPAVLLPDLPAAA